MQTNTIKYVGFYDSNSHIDEKRNTFLAATNKMNYIASVIVKSGYSIEIISPSWSSNLKGYYKHRKEQIATEARLIVGSTFGAQNYILRRVRILCSWIWLFMYLSINTRKNEKVLVYHSMMLIYPVLWAKKFRKFKMILEVEEIYQNVSAFSKKMSRKEFDMFEKADMYLFSTELLNKKLNENKKPYAIVYGNYHTQKKMNNTSFDDHKIHVVYAGIIDRIKGGAFEASKAAINLTDKFHVHIIGFGSDDDIQTLKKLIGSINKNSACQITYDGVFEGEEYISFLQKCQIGLSTQVPDEKYINTSFPSKIISYMANNLGVVSMRIRCVEESEIGKIVCYYDEQTPESIAKAIESACLSGDYKSKELIERLDQNFVNNISKMLD